MIVIIAWLRCVDGELPEALRFVRGARMIDGRN
jgi:hypothetical protein